MMCLGKHWEPQVHGRAPKNHRSCVERRRPYLHEASEVTRHRDRPSVTPQSDLPFWARGEQEKEARLRYTSRGPAARSLVLPLRRYQDRRELRDGAAPPALPAALRDAALRACYAACEALVAAKRPQLPDFRPDVCLCNFYPPGKGRLGMHQARGAPACAPKIPTRS